MNPHAKTITKLYLEFRAAEYQQFYQRLRTLDPELELVAPPHWEGEDDYGLGEQPHHESWLNCLNYVLRKRLGVQKVIRNMLGAEEIINAKTEAIGNDLEESEDQDIIIYTNPSWMGISKYAADPFTFVALKTGLHHLGIVSVNGQRRIDSKWGYKGPALLHQPDFLPSFWQGHITIRRPTDESNSI